MEKESIYYEKLEAGNRKYYIDLKESSKGKKYISINHSWVNQDGDNEYSRILLFKNQFSDFAKALYKTVKKSEEFEYIEKVREEYPNAYTPWQHEDEELLKTLYASGKTVAELSEIFSRQPGAIEARINKLNESSVAVAV